MSSLQRGILQALAPASAAAAPLHTLAVVGGSGPLGAAVLEALVASGAFGAVQVAVQPQQDGGPASLKVGLRGLQAVDVDALAAPTAVLVFDAPDPGSLRGARYSRAAREAALYTPSLKELPALAQALHARGTRALVLVSPALEASLPGSVSRGVLDAYEQALLAMHFEHLLIIRPARARGRAMPRIAGRVPLRQRLQALAAWLLGSLKYMIPRQQRPLLAREVAAFVAHAVRALRDTPAGTHVADAPLLWWAAQQPTLHAAVRTWLRIAPDLADVPAPPQAQA